MHILFTHRYFLPDTAPYGALLKQIAQEFFNQGHDARVFSSKVSYGSTAEAAMDDFDFPLKRCFVFRENKKNQFVRAANVLIYCFALFFHILKTRPQVVTAATFPPVMAAWFASLAARITGAKFIYHMMDIHPEVSQISGGILGRVPVSSVLRWLDNQSLRRASLIIVLSEDMRATLQSRGIDGLRIEVINNFMLEADASANPPKEWVKKPNAKRIIFAGNLGRFQNLEAVTEGISLCLANNRDVELLFMGDGQAKAQLQKKWGQHPQIKFADYLPFAQAKALIADADLGIVSLSPSIYKVAYPSKILTYMGLGVPVLALVEPKSELARGLAVNKLGVVANDFSPVAIRDAVQSFLDHPIDSRAVQNWYKKNASFDYVLSRWFELVSTMTQKSKA